MPVSVMPACPASFFRFPTSGNPSDSRPRTVGDQLGIARKILAIPDKQGQAKPE